MIHAKLKAHEKTGNFMNHRSRELKFRTTYFSFHKIISRNKNIMKNTMWMISLQFFYIVKYIWFETCSLKEI